MKKRNVIKQTTVIQAINGQCEIMLMWLMMMICRGVCHDWSAFLDYPRQDGSSREGETAAEDVVVGFEQCENVLSCVVHARVSCEMDHSAWGLVVSVRIPIVQIRVVPAGTVID